MTRKVLILAALAASLVACDASRETLSVPEYTQWANARVSEMGILIREFEAHVMAANRERGLENEQPWRDRSQELINGTIAVTSAVRGWQAVPEEAADEHALVVELATYAETMVVNAAEAIADPTGPYMRAAIEANSNFKRIEPDTILALKTLTEGAGGP